MLPLLQKQSRVYARNDVNEIHLSALPRSGSFMEETHQVFWSYEIPPYRAWSRPLFKIFFGDMMTSSNGNIFRVTGHLCGEFTGHWWISRTKASDTELWCFLWSAPLNKCCLKRRRAHYGVTLMDKLNKRICRQIDGKLLVPNIHGTVTWGLSERKITMFELVEVKIVPLNKDDSTLQDVCAMGTQNTVAWVNVLRSVCEGITLTKGTVNFATVTYGDTWRKLKEHDIQQEGQIHCLSGKALCHPCRLTATRIYHTIPYRTVP